MRLNDGVFNIAPLCATDAYGSCTLTELLQSQAFVKARTQSELNSPDWQKICVKRGFFDRLSTHSRPALSSHRHGRHESGKDDAAPFAVRVSTADPSQNATDIISQVDPKADASDSSRVGVSPGKAIPRPVQAILQRFNSRVNAARKVLQSSAHD